MKPYHFLLFVYLFWFLPRNNELIPSGKPISTIFANFHQGITGSAKNETAFELVWGGAFGKSNWIAGWTILAEKSIKKRIAILLRLATRLNISSRN